MIQWLKRRRARNSVQPLVRCCLPGCDAEAVGCLHLLRQGDRDPLKLYLCRRCGDALMTANMAHVSHTSNCR